MKNSKLNFWGPSRYWWILLIIGLCFVVAGFTYYFWPMIGYAVISQLFGWMMVVSGIVALCVSAGTHRPAGWGWWLVGGIINMFVGFMLIRSLVLSGMLFPYFLSLVFAMWGIAAVFSSISQCNRKYWWLYLINGILLLVISFLLVEAGYTNAIGMISLLTSIAFIYWGFSIAMISLDMRPGAIKEEIKEFERSEK